MAGCGRFHEDNSAVVFTRPPAARDESLATIWLKTCYLYPARDYLLFTWLGRAVAGDEAWNVKPDDGVGDGPFFVNRDIDAVAPQALTDGSCMGPPPIGPWRVRKCKDNGATPGFVGEDASGRRFLVKLDRPDYPELGTSAEIIAARLTWLVGYHVPPTFLVNIEGTDDPAFDGRRAVASEFIPGRILGPANLDHYRMRREVRALRVLAAWLNDTDRLGRNTVFAMQVDRAVCYQVDFNSSLGSWNGRLKENWRGRRYAWDVEYQFLGAVTLGLVDEQTAFPKPTLASHLSPDGTTLALGSWPFTFDDDPRRWRQQFPCTAFDRMTLADAAWIAARIGRISQAQLEAVVAGAGYSREHDRTVVLEMLFRRRQAVLAAWGGNRLSPNAEAR